MEMADDTPKEDIGADINNVRHSGAYQIFRAVFVMVDDHRNNDNRIGCLIFPSWCKGAFWACVSSHGERRIKLLWPDVPSNCLPVSWLMTNFGSIINWRRLWVSWRWTRFPEMSQLNGADSLGSQRDNRVHRDGVIEPPHTKNNNKNRQPNDISINKCRMENKHFLNARYYCIMTTIRLTHRQPTEQRKIILFTLPFFRFSLSAPHRTWLFHFYCITGSIIKLHWLERRVLSYSQHKAAHTNSHTQTRKSSNEIPKTIRKKILLVVVILTNLQLDKVTNFINRKLSQMQKRKKKIRQDDGRRPK